MLESYDQLRVNQAIFQLISPPFLIWRSCGLVEKRLLAEKDVVIQARIEALLELLQNTNNEESSVMVLNSLETYKKFLICETELQNKVTSQTVESLIKALLIIFCHRKEFEHLNSMVRKTKNQNCIDFFIEIFLVLD